MCLLMEAAQTERAFIGYIHYEVPIEEQNFTVLLEMINAMEVREE